MSSTYFDTSAFVKLFVSDEPDAEIARDVWLGSDAIYACRLLYIESHAAIAAARRNHRISKRQHSLISRNVANAWLSVDIIELSDELMHLAARCANDYSLRGYDATHLAAALLVETDLFLTWDTKLAAAAHKCGMQVPAKPGTSL